ncbi:MAG TPA: gamma-glutamylcyclotransferase family protein [Solirubrobacteraceae bacterium]|nr:gamma-glutamylcyclotransferase family protein [Solirubrobacteraceae bacterium]
MIPYFAYGTTQRGFTHHRRLAPLLGEPVGRFRTVEAHAVVVPHAAACSNPGCEYVHRMAALVAGFAPLHAEGDLFLITPEALAAVDELETAGPYVREEIAVVAGAEPRLAHAYRAREPDRWRVLVERGGADALAAYPRELADVEERKACCVRAPGHPPPHDVIDPL